METKKWEVKIPNGSNGFVNIIESDFNISTFYGGFERTIPNARLAVCAPEMIEMLELLTTVYSADNIEKAKLLITKATTI